MGTNPSQNVNENASDELAATYHLDTLPPWQPNSATPAKAGDPAKWSGRGRLATPPAIGTEVMVRMNDIGPGTVTGYFIEAGYLGMYVKPHEPPAWWVKQVRESKRARKDTMVFGAELASRSAASIVDVAADDIARLRKSDVFRVLEEAKESDELAYVADYVKLRRPELAAEVGRCLTELEQA